jgi:L-histidine N-alpha-methyltransferase
MTSEAGLAQVPAQRRRPDFIDRQPTREDFRSAVIEGLSATAKSIPCRFLYDAQGSALFDRICDLPEYYPTRTETGILRDRAVEIAAHIGPKAQLIELGSGSSAKVRILLDTLDAPAAYVPIDISADHLLNAASAIQADYPGLQVQAICADYGMPLVLPSPRGGRRAGFYPGSTIGNLTPTEAGGFLRQWATQLGRGAALIVGVDLRKSPTVLEAANDDSQGVTAAFSLNLLGRANRELGADFDLRQFRHQARYLADEGRVAIHLRSLVDQDVTVAGRRFHFAKDERLHVEDSWKYSLEDFRDLASEAGFSPTACWVDDRELFSVHLLEV